MSRRRRAQSHASHERWLVSYADFITLLFAFFVVLYSSSQVDQRKVGKLAVAIQVAFQELGVFPASSTKILLDSSEPIPASTVQAIQNVQRSAVIPPQPNDPAEAIEEEQNVATLENELHQALQREIDLREVSLYRETDGLVISLREFGFFDSGSTLLKPSALPALDRIASILAIRTCPLRIEGHTDNIPIHTSQIESNWELSAARATELVRILILRYGYSPQRLSAAGYAQYHPIASNDTPEGRAQNRRVDVVILTQRVIRDPGRQTAPAKPSALVH